MIWNVGTFPSRRVFKSYLIVSSSSPGSSIRHFSLEGKMRKRLIRVKTVEWSTIQAFICSHRYLLQPDRGKKERKKPTGDVTVISGTPDLLLVHSHTHTHSVNHNQQLTCVKASLCLFTFVIFSSLLFSSFFPPASILGPRGSFVQSVQITPRSLVLAPDWPCLYSLDQAGSASEKILFLVLIQVAGKKISSWYCKPPPSWVPRAPVQVCLLTPPLPQWHIQESICNNMCRRV